MHFRRMTFRPRGKVTKSRRFSRRGHADEERTLVTSSKRMFSAFVFLAVGVLCSAASNSTVVAPPARCESPKQWEGTAWFTQERTGTVRSIDISYDAVNRRIRSVTTIVVGPYAGFSMEAILLFDENRFYFLPGETKLCVELNKFFEFKPVGVPPDAEFQYSVTYGLGKNSVHSNTWGKSYKVDVENDGMEYPWVHHHHDHHGHTHTWYFAFTDDLCAPVLETIYEGDLLDKDDADDPTEILDQIRYTALSAGINNPDVFKPPSYCNSGGSKNATLMAMLGDTFEWRGFMFV